MMDWAGTQGEIVRSIIQANVLIGGGGLNLDQVCLTPVDLSL